MIKFMENVLKNIKEVKFLEKITDNHLIGGKLSFETDKYIFIFNSQVFEFGGIQSRIFTTKKAALKILIEKLDKYYNKLHAHMNFHKDLNSMDDNYEN